MEPTGQKQALPKYGGASTQALVLMRQASDLKIHGYLAGGREWDERFADLQTANKLDEKKKLEGLF